MKSSLLKGNRQVFKTTIPHLLVCVISIAYLIIGGYVFMYFEQNEVVQILNSTSRNTSGCYRMYGFKDAYPKELTLPTSIMLAFTILTTIGYGDVVPHTPSGKIFCIFYGIFGIPLMLLAIANLGRFLASAVNSLYRRIKRSFVKSTSGRNDDYQDKSLPTFLLLGLFAIYLCLGGFIVQSWDDKKTFLDGVYFSFISLTSIGFGDIVPPETHLSLTLLYVGFGLTLSTMAVDILADYLRKLHYFGTVVKNSAKATIWFGGKLITVKELITAVGRYLGAPDYALEDLCNNLDQIVNNAIEERKLENTGRFSTAPTHEDLEEFQGSVKPIFLQAVGDDKISFIDEEGHTHRISAMSIIENSHRTMNSL